MDAADVIELFVQRHLAEQLIDALVNWLSSVYLEDKPEQANAEGDFVQHPSTEAAGGEGLKRKENSGAKRRKLDSELRTQDSEFRTQNSELRTQDSELRTQDSGLISQDSELRTQESGLRTR